MLTISRVAGYLAIQEYLSGHNNNDVYSVFADTVSSILFSFLQDKFFLLELNNGFLRLMYDFGFSDGPKLLENNLPKLQINDARYHEVHSLVLFTWLSRTKLDQ